MKDRKLRKKIREIPIPDHQEEALLRTIWAAKQTGLHPERQRMTKMEFFTGQIGFIGQSMGGKAACDISFVFGDTGGRSEI